MSNPSDFYKLAVRAVRALEDIAEALTTEAHRAEPEPTTADLGRDLADRGSSPGMRALGEVMARSAPTFDTPEVREAVRRALESLDA